MVVQKNTHGLPNYAEEEPKYHVADLFKFKRAQCVSSKIGRWIDILQ
jgi:hypothetical protein